MSHGCRGGLPSHAFEYIKRNEGLCSEKEYPYREKEGACRSNECYRQQSKPFSIVKVTGSEADLAEAIQTGPVAISIDASPSCF